MRYFILNKKNDRSIKVRNELERLLSLDKNNIMDEINPDFVFSIGGDGTLLKSLHKYENILEKVILIGIHTGKLGFLCNYQENDLELILQEIQQGNIKIDENKLLKLKYGNEEYYAINEIRIESPYKTMITKVYINGKELEVYRGNGLNLSTSLGSSGYNHSLNGPFIQPNLESIILSEIAGINHNAYRSLKSPLVLCNNEIITLKGTFFNCIIGNDSLYRVVIDDEEIELEIMLSNKKVRMLNTKGIDYIDRLRNAFIG